MNNWGANHGAISYGHIGADLITMCSMLRIPVSMHNVPEEKIFRPSAWNAFGMDKKARITVHVLLTALCTNNIPEQVIRVRRIEGPPGPDLLFHRIRIRSRLWRQRRY